MIEKLKVALKRKFSVIIFDIDGVLAEPCKKISTPMVESIVSIINRKVYVSIVSGRACHSSVAHRRRNIKTIDEVFYQIRCSDQLEHIDNLKYLFGLEQNGAVIFDAFLNQLPEAILFKPQQKRMDTKVQEKIQHELSAEKNSLFSYLEFRSHSMALWVNDHYKTQDKQQFIKETIDNLLIRCHLNDQYEAFQTNTAIDINRIGVSKAAAVDFYINAGFNLKQIARVGDSTYKGGNDTPMVCYGGNGDNGGFSVKHYEELDAYPIVSLPKAIGKEGVEATEWLLNNIRFNENQAYLFNTSRPSLA